MAETVLAIACTIHLSTTIVELVVLRDDPSWRWEVRFARGQTLAAGTAETKVAAQVTAQQAFERRLKRSGLQQRGFSGYRWTDAVYPAVVA